MASRRGRHSRPSKISKAAAVASTAAITTSVAVIAGNATPADASTGGTQVHAPAAREVTTVVKETARWTVTVAAGDTLAGISRAHCGTYTDWPALFRANHDKIRDPDLIYPGQVLTLDCSSARITTTAIRRDRFDGKHGPCGDGDGDGFDAQCWEIGRGHVSRVSRVTHHAAVASFSGTYSFAALERLWVSAGGNPGAEATAACIAEHESGGRPDAISPTNDYGLWQINGSHGALATLNPSGNAKAAVLISGDGTNWSPWTTHFMCGV